MIAIIISLKIVLWICFLLTINHLIKYYKNHISFIKNLYSILALSLAYVAIVSIGIMALSLGAFLVALLSVLTIFSINNNKGDLCHEFKTKTLLKNIRSIGLIGLTSSGLIFKQLRL